LKHFESDNLHRIVSSARMLVGLDLPNAEINRPPTEIVNSDDEDGTPVALHLPTSRPNENQRILLPRHERRLAVSHQ
jgi:hypothetical protein